MRLLPPKRDALILHFHKVAYMVFAAGYIRGTSHIPTRMEESPTN